MDEKEVSCSVGAACEEVPSNLKIHNWIIKLRDETVFCQLIVFQSSVFIWMGLELAKMANLSVSLMALGQPSVTTLVGSSDDFAQRLGQKIAKACSIVAFVSYNLPENREYLEPGIEKSVFAELGAQLPQR